MVWVGAFAIGILISIADIFLLQNNKRAKTCITVILKDTLMVILTSLFVLKYIFNFENNLYKQTIRKNCVTIEKKNI